MEAQQDQLSSRAENLLDVLTSLTPEELNEFYSRISDLIEIDHNASYHQRE